MFTAEVHFWYRKLINSCVQLKCLKNQPLLGKIVLSQLILLYHKFLILKDLNLEKKLNNKP